MKNKTLKICITAGARAIDCLINSSEGQKISVRLKRFVQKCNVQIVAVQRQMLSSAKAFSVAEAMIVVLIGSIVLGMSAPMISRQLKHNNMNDVQFQVLNKKIQDLQAEVRANNNVFPSGFLMMTFGSCPTNGWSDVSALYEGRFLKISSDAQVTHDAVLPEHMHSVGYFGIDYEDNAFFWYKKEPYNLKYDNISRWVPGEGNFENIESFKKGASISYSLVTTKEIYDADANTLEPKSITVKVCQKN